ncbi:MAG: triose-phosphate isomerase [Spirochaetaceae bacterium]|jgi:triosephosphate isomerase|nr:triose-phosphate isomerase [Spirochaetaceae bacterium]
MANKARLKPPFFEIGPKSYLYGDDVFSLALAADKAAEAYQVDILFTAPLVDIRRIAEGTRRLLVIAPHMDPLRPGRGLADVLPESLAAAGAAGVMLNHCEKPLGLNTLEQTLRRADEVGLLTIVCTDTIAQAAAAARLRPDVIVAEPSELIGTGQTSGMSYVKAAVGAVKSVDPGILVLQAAGISCGKDVYDVISAGAEATGSSSGIAKARDRAAMVDEMIRAVREAWDSRSGLGSALR